MSSFTLDFDTLPLGAKFRSGNTRDVQIAFDKDFASMTFGEQQEMREFLSKKSFNKDE
jgi:hypothetical protein